MPEVRRDGWSNVVSSLGRSERDRRTFAEIERPRIITQEQLTNLYAADPLAKRICNLPAKEQTRKWVRFAVGEDADASKDISKRLREIGAQRAVTEGLIWSRLYGGACVVMGIDDGQDPSMPLNETGIRTFDWFKVLDRFDLQVRSRSNQLRNYGEPETYQVQTKSQLVDSSGKAMVMGPVVHASRVLRFDGTLTPNLQRDRNEGWADSIFVSLYEAIRDFWSSYGGMAHLLTDFSQAVYKVKGLANMIAGNQDDVVIKRLQMLDLVRSIVRAIAVDADGEEFTRQQTPTAGLPELLDKTDQLVSSITGIPVTLLMGRSPAGENATGESDIRLFYDQVATEQENELGPKLERLFRLVMLSKDGPTGGQEPKDWSFAFVPLLQLNEMQLADVRKKQAETDAVYLDRSVVHPSEVRQSRFGGAEYTTETTLDPKWDELDALLDSTNPQPDPEEDEEIPDDDDGDEEGTEAGRGPGE